MCVTDRFYMNELKICLIKALPNLKIVILTLLAKQNYLDWHARRVFTRKKKSQDEEHSLRSKVNRPWLQISDITTANTEND